MSFVIISSFEAMERPLERGAIMLKRHYEIKEFSILLWQWGCPLLLQSHSLRREKRKGDLSACCRFENLSSQEVVSLTVSLSCVRKDWFPAASVESFTYEGLHVPGCQTFGQDIWIPLPDPRTQEFSVFVQRAQFADGSVWTGCSEPLRCIRGTRPLSELGDLRDIYLWKASQLSSAPQVCLPDRHNGWWQCGCGEIVLGSSGFCPKCRADIVMLIAASDPDYLNTQRDEYQEYLEQRAVTEAEDRRKAKEKAFRVSRYRRIAVAGFATVFAAAAAFYGFSVYRQQVLIPQDQYQAAFQLLESGQYEQAQAAFTAMGNYQDAPEQAQAAASELKYREGADLETSEDYSRARTIFESLGGYKDSRSRYKECTYQMALEEIEAGYYSSAQIWLQKLGYYKDAKDLLAKVREEEKVQKLIQLGEEKKWDEFSEYLYFNEDPELLKREDIQKLYQQCVKETPFHLKTVLSPYPFGRSDISEVEAKQGYVEDAQEIEDWDILYLTVIVTGGNTLIQDSYEITVTWPDRMVSQYFFEVWKGTGSTWTDSVSLGTTYNHPPGTVLISIERRSTGQVVQTYEFYSNGNSRS